MPGTVSWKLWRKTVQGMLVESFLEVEEPAGTALSCHLSLISFARRCKLLDSPRTAGRGEMVC